MPLSQFDERAPFTTVNAAAAGFGPAIITLVNGSTYGTRIDQITASWNGAAPLEIDVDVNDGFGDIATIGTVTIPLAVGTVTETVDVIAALFPVIQPFIILPSGYQLRFTVKVLIAGSDVFGLWASGGNF
jgi:hypothetical protein